jgi:hypothetical protein
MRDISECITVSARRDRTRDESMLQAPESTAKSIHHLAEIIDPFPTLVEAGRP